MTAMSHQKYVTLSISLSVCLSVCLFLCVSDCRLSCCLSVYLCLFFHLCVTLSYCLLACYLSRFVVTLIARQHVCGSVSASAIYCGSRQTDRQLCRYHYSSCQSAATSKIVKALLVLSLPHVIQQVPDFLFELYICSITSLPTSFSVHLSMSICVQNGCIAREHM